MSGAGTTRRWPHRGNDRARGDRRGGGGGGYGGGFSIAAAAAATTASAETAGGFRDDRGGGRTVAASTIAATTGAVAAQRPRWRVAGGGGGGSARPREVGGYVAAIKESFGFIEPVNAADLPAQLYFNFGAVLRRDELRVGDEVHFEVDSGRDGRSSAVRVQLLKPGTLPPPPRAKGVVERAPNRQGFGGRISYAAAEGAAPESVSFEGRDVRERDPLDAGDLVGLCSPPTTAAAASARAR